MHRAPVITAVLLVVILAACGEDTPSASRTVAEPTATPPATPAPSPTVAPTPTATPGDTATPEGWRRVAVAERGFSIAVPEDWEELSPDVLTGSGAMERMLEANPEAEAAVEQAISLIEGGEIALFLFDTGQTWATTGFATNVNVINIGPVIGSAEDAAIEIANAIRQEVPITGEVEAETLTLPSGEAVRIGYEWEVAGGANDATPVQVSQYAILGRSGTGFIVSMSVASAVADRYDDTFRQMAESFREDPAP